MLRGAEAPKRMSRCRGEQPLVSDGAEEVAPDAVADPKDLFGAVLGGVDVHPEGTFTLGQADDAGDLPGNFVCSYSSRVAVSSGWPACA